MLLSVASWFDRSRMDVSESVRRLVRAPAFTAIAVVSLALGIGANTAIFGIIDAALLRTLPVAEPDRLVQLAITDTAFTNPIWEAFRDRQQVLDAPFAWAAERLDLSTAGEKRPVDGLIVSGGFFSTLGVTAALGRTLTHADDRRGGGVDGPVAVLGHAFWRDRYAASPSVLGSTLHLNGHAFTIVGVAPPRFFGLDVGRRFDVAVPLGTEPLLHGADTRLDRGTMWWLQIMGHLAAGDDLARAEAGVRALMPAIRDATRPVTPATAATKGTTTQQTAPSKQTPTQPMPVTTKPATATHDDGYLREPVTLRSAAGGVSDLRGRYETALRVLMGVVALVLLIVCATLANLLLARATARQQELAVRLALGASRGRLMRQALIESLLIAIGGASLGLLFAHWATPLLLRQLSSRHTRLFLDVGVDWRLLGFTTLAAVLTTVLFGVAPAFRSTRLSANDLLKSGSRAIATGWRGVSLEKVFVAIQMAVSLVLIVTAAWFVRSFTTLVTLDPGFAREQVLLMQVDTTRIALTADGRRRLYADLLDRLRTLPGVQSAAYSEVTPISGNAWQQDIVVADAGGGHGSGDDAGGGRSDGFGRSGGDDDGSRAGGGSGRAQAAGIPGGPAGLDRERGTGRVANTHLNRVSPEYFDTLRTPLRAGRNFDARDTFGAPAVAIVNETFVRRFVRGASPLGARLFLGRRAPGDAGMEIVGVVADSKYRSLRETPPPTTYVAMAQDAQPYRRVSFAMRVRRTETETATATAISARPAASTSLAGSGSGPGPGPTSLASSSSVSASASASAGPGIGDAMARALIPSLIAAVREQHRDMSVEFTTLARQVDDSLIRDRVLALLSAFFGALALLVAGLGLYGVLSLAVARRRRELGVRMALGAPPASLRALVLRDVFLVALVGIAIGAVVTLLAGRVVRSLLFDLEPTDPGTWLLALATLGTVAALAGYVPARRAARIDPVVALREE